jgi:hypothetical protein
MGERQNFEGESFYNSKVKSENIAESPLKTFYDAAVKASKVKQAWRHAQMDRARHCAVLRSLISINSGWVATRRKTEGGSIFTQWIFTLLPVEVVTSASSPGARVRLLTSARGWPAEPERPLTRKDEAENSSAALFAICGTGWRTESGKNGSLVGMAVKSKTDKGMASSSGAALVFAPAAGEFVELVACAAGRSSSHNSAIAAIKPFGKIRENFMRVRVSG